MLAIPEHVTKLTAMLQQSSLGKGKTSLVLLGFSAPSQVYVQSSCGCHAHGVLQINYAAAQRRKIQRKFDTQQRGLSKGHLIPVRQLCQMMLMTLS